MATRIKTVEYFLGARNTVLASATRNDFAQVAVRLPESSKTFRSVRLIVQCRDTVTTAASLTAPVLGIQIDAVAFSNATLGNPPGNTGESGQYVFERDVTAYFQTNFTGQQHNVGAGVQFTGPTTINHVAKLIITYEYDDASAEHVKTVRIPIESGTGALTATLAAIGTNQIPALDTFLPEGGKTYRRIWLEATYNESLAGTTNDPTLGISIGGGAEQVTGLHESGLASSCAGWYCFDQGATPTWSTASAQALQARSSNITNSATFDHTAFVLYVTYTFDPSTTTRVLNSVQLILPPIFTPGGTLTTDENEQHTDFWIQEPGTITLRQSGALVWYSQTGTVTPRVRFGAQAHRTYTDQNRLFCGASFFTQRVDSGSAQGAGVTLARGKNTIEYGAYVSTLGTTPCNVGGFLILNYESDVSAQGVGVHNQSLCFGVLDSQTAGTQTIVAAAQRVFQPSTHWFRNGFGFVSNQVTGVTTSFSGYVQFEAESAASELSAGGWENQGCVPLTTEGELGWYPVAMNVGLQSPNDWERWSEAPDTTRMDPMASRRFRIISGMTSTMPLSIWTTMHNITYTVESTVSGSAGGTVTARLCRASDGTVLKSTTRVGNGTVSFTWYDNTESVYVEARETDALVARSGNGTATGSP